MWTSSYLPKREVILLSAALVLGTLLLCGLLAHQRRCPVHARPQVTLSREPIPVRLYLPRYRLIKNGVPLPHGPRLRCGR